MTSYLNQVPLAYTTPRFPSLYWPFQAGPAEPQYLYTLTDIWRFTLYWTIITISTAHFLVAMWAVLMQFSSAFHRRKYLRTGGAGGSESSVRAGVEGGDDMDEIPPTSIPMTTPMTTTSGKEAIRGGRDLTVKNRKLLGESPLRETVTWVWLVPLVYMVIGGLEALLAGGIVGVILGAVYNAGYMRMSTWTPLIWGIVHMLVLILSSFRIQGGL